MTEATTADALLPNHSDNVDEELNRIRLALDAVYGTAASMANDDKNNNYNNNNNNNIGTDPWHQQRQLSNHYLTRFQSTSIAWVVCDRLLWEGITTTENNNRTMEDVMKQQQNHFFAAQTLLTKCRSDHDVQQLLNQQQQQQIPPSSTNHQLSPVLVSLRDSLLHHLSRSIHDSSYTTTGGANHNKALTTRLAMCVSALAVQMGWFTVIDEILSNVKSDHSLESFSHSQTIFALLRALPEECASDRLLLLDDDHRFVMRDHFIHTSATVFAFFLNQLSLANSHGCDARNRHLIQHQVLQSWYAWIRYVPIRPHVIAESPLLPATVEILILSGTAATTTTTSSLSLDIIEQAADVLVEILRMYPSRGPPDNQILVQQMLSLLSRLPLEQVLATATPTEDAGSMESDQDHIVRDYCRIVTEMGESYLEWILNAASSSSTMAPQEKEAAFHLVDWILQCSSSVSDNDVAGITLHFWYRMVMELEQMEPYEVRQELVDALSGRLLQFITVAALNLMKFPNDISEIADDEVEDINRHRYYVSETVEDCCRLLGGQAVLIRIAELLEGQVRNHMSANAMDCSNLLGHGWQSLESCLSCLIAIHIFVSEDENQVLPFVFEQLIPGLVRAAAAVPQLGPSQPTTMPPPLRFTVCKVVGKYARWLASRSRSNPELMPPLLPFLANGLYVSECAPSAAVAIKELCVESHPHSFAVAQPVLELYEQISATIGGSSSENPPVLHLRDELQLLEGVCLALSKHVQVEPQSSNNGAVFLQRLVQPIGNRIASNLNSPNASPRTVLPEIQRLAVLVQHLKVLMDLSSPSSSTTGGAPALHPLVELMQSLWPFLETVVARFSNDTNIAEQVCRLHKHAMRSCGPIAYRPMLNPLIRYLVEGYDRSHQSPFLYAASICVSEYDGTNNLQNSDVMDVQQNLYQMVEAMSNTTFSFLKNLQDFNNHPDVVEELFYLMERMMNHCSETLLKKNPPVLLQTLLQAAILGMNLDHHGAHKGTMTFIDSLLSSKVLLIESGNADYQQQRATLEHVLVLEGGGLLNNLIRSVVGDLPSYSPKIPDILWKFRRIFRNSGDMLRQWVTSSLSSSSTTSTTPPTSVSVLLMVPDQLKHEFMGAIVSTDLPKEDFLLSLRTFQNACNRHRRYLQNRKSELAM